MSDPPDTDFHVYAPALLYAPPFAFVQRFENQRGQPLAGIDGKSLKHAQSMDELRLLIETCRRIHEVSLSLRRSPAPFPRFCAVGVPPFRSASGRKRSDKPARHVPSRCRDAEISGRRATYHPTLR